VDVGFNINEVIPKKEVVSRVGRVTWDETFGGSDDEGANSIIQTTDGGYMVAGFTKSKGAGIYDSLVIKFNESGDILKYKVIGGSGNDWTSSIVQTSDGGYAVAGCNSSKGAGRADFWVIKLDESGNIEWDQTYGYSGREYASSIVQTSDGGYAVAGCNSSKGAGQEDIWVIKLDDRGNRIWDRTYGGSCNDEAYSIIQTTDGGYAVAGDTKSYGAGKEDVWVIKLDEQGNLE